MRGSPEQQVVLVSFFVLFFKTDDCYHRGITHHVLLLLGVSMLRTLTDGGRLGMSHSGTMARATFALLTKGHHTAFNHWAALYKAKPSLL